MLKSYRVGWVAHEILVTAQSPNSPFHLDLGLRLWTGTWIQACQYALFVDRSCGMLTLGQYFVT